MQVLDFVPLILGIIALVNDHTLMTLINYIPGTSKIDHIVDINELIKHSAIKLIILGVVLVLIGSLGCFGACFKIKWMLYLVSNHHVATTVSLLLL